MFKLMKLCLISLSLMVLFSLSVVTRAQEASQDTPSNDREIMRLGRGRVNALAWHPDGEVLAVASGTGLYFVDIDLEIIGEGVRESGDLGGVAWRPDGEMLAVSAQDGVLLVDNDAEVIGQFTSSLSHPRELLWRGDGNVLVIQHRGEFEVYQVSADGTSYDYVTAMDVTVIPDEGIINNHVMRWSDDSTQLLVAIREWNTIDYDVLDIVAYDSDTFEQLPDDAIIDREALNDFFAIRQPELISPNEQLKVKYEWYGNDNRQLEIYNYITDEFIITYPSNAYVHANVWTLDSHYFIIATENGVLQRFDSQTRDIMVSRRLFTPAYDRLMWSPDGNTLLSTRYSDLSIPTDVWTAFDGDADLPDQSLPLISSLVRWIDSNRILFQGGDGWRWQSWRIVDIDTGRTNQSFYVQRPRDVTTFLSFDWNRDFTRFAYQNPETPQSLLITTILDTPNGEYSWDYETSQFVDWEDVPIPSEEIILTFDEAVKYAYWNPDSQDMLNIALGDDETTVIEVWDVITNERLSQRTLAPSPSRDEENCMGRRINTRAFNTYSAEFEPTYILDVCDRETGELLFSLEEDLLPLPNSRFIEIVSNPRPPIASSPDAPYMAVASRDRVRIVDDETGEVIDIIPTRNVIELTWHPDGHWLVGSISDGTIRIWDVSDLMEGEE